MREAADNGRKALIILHGHNAGKRKPRVISLYTQITPLKKDTNKSVTDYVMRTETILTVLRNAGQTVDDVLFIVMILYKWKERLIEALGTLFHQHKSQQQGVDVLGIQNRTPASRKRKNTVTTSWSYLPHFQIKNESRDKTRDVSCFTCCEKGHLSKISSNNNYNKRRKPRHRYCKSTAHKRDFCCVKRRDTMKKATDVEECSFSFKMDDYNLRKIIILTEMLCRRRSYPTHR